jgi:hypothetical protein
MPKNSFSPEIDEERERLITYTQGLSNQLGCVIPAAQTDFIDRMIGKDIPEWPGILTYLERVQAHLSFDEDLEELDRNFLSPQP